MNILFVLKHRQNYNEENYSYSLQSGLLNSAEYVKDMLIQDGFEANLVQVVDNNEIDRSVVKYGADVVIIEALWCVPEKFDILQKLHPKVKWVIAVHSEIPFLSNEGISIKWITEYLKYKNVSVSFNSYNTFRDMKAYFNKSDRIIYLPNFYPVSTKEIVIKEDSLDRKELHVGCFGALRPLKNQLIQALASIIYAKEQHKKLYFHINSTRIDNHSAYPVLENIRNLFASLSPDRCVLVEHPWLERKEFLDLLNTMDATLQVSFSESFNIVCADAVSEEIPTVVSKEIYWMPEQCKSECTSVTDIMSKLDYVLRYRKFITTQARNCLIERANHALQTWRVSLNKLK